MVETGGHVLVVDDNLVNLRLLARAVEEQGHRVTTAENGRQALDLLSADDHDSFDLVLLDILMPEMDGYQVLERVKGDDRLRHLPVIMISAVDQMASVIRCIRMGATDYLPKPFNAALLQARLNASLAEKRLRDLELEYLEQVGYVIDAAGSVETTTFEAKDLDGVAARDDALGQLARVFQRMAREVYLREQRLKQQLLQLHLDIEEMRRSVVESPSLYVPMDRRQALARGRALPERTTGAALLADISGFTPLTASLARELGRRRGAEELTRLLDQVYGALIAEVHRYWGSVVGFSGDAITCWLDGDDGLRAIACGLAMQEAMTRFETLATPTGTSFTLAVKIAAVTGPVRRFLVGDPELHNVEVLAGRTLDDLALAEHHAQRGEVLISAAIAREAGERITTAAWREDKASGARFAVVDSLHEPVPDQPWPELPPGSLSDEQSRPWLLPAVYRRMQSGTPQFLAELRPAVALFLHFGGIDYDDDEQAGNKLDAYVRWVQAVIEPHEGALVQLTIGDKGSYLYAAFGAPVAHSDDETRAVRAALTLQTPPPKLRFITDIQIGVAQGQMRTGSYGSPSQRTYGILGDRTNLAAQLMQAATGDILCDEAVVLGAQAHLAFDALPPIQVRGRTAPVRVSRPTGALLPRTESVGDLQAVIDRLAPGEQLTLKVASVLGRSFSSDVLRALYPVAADKSQIDEHLHTLERLGLVAHGPSETSLAFQSELLHKMAYDSMLFAQRRHLHRQAAEWYERSFADNIAPYYSILAHHWRQAAEPARAADFLEKAGQQALEAGSHEDAQRLLQESLELGTGSAVLSTDFYHRHTTDFEGALRYALTRLEHELDPQLTYHNLWHTRDEVLPATRRLAASSGIEAEDMRLLEVGAVYHDIGFLVQRHEHEQAGADLVAEVLPQFGFTPEQIAVVQGMIMATRFPQSAQTPLEEILADADMDVLGREDFLSRSQALRDEFDASGTAHSDRGWYRRQLVFLESHCYFTEATRALRDSEKQNNISAIKEELDHIGS
jgi:CheY-like chemotaxis protein/class 3 adenylate cyclase/predicted metal-dependent HD superfamily phosphohydrolase